MQSGWKLEGNKNMILLRKHNKKLIFDIKIETSRGVLFDVRIENGQELMTTTVNNKLETKRLTSMKPMLFLDIY
jgi:N12 class adenine-specific DNA methylase